MMASSSFNTSSRKDDVSLKLKAQNIKNARTETKRLEEESKKMELRLNELKVAMSREKEERQGSGGFWQSGNTDGSLMTHAQDILKKNMRQIEKTKSKGLKGRRVLVLKDEPIAPPENTAPKPGTFAYIAKSKPDVSPPKESSRIKGPKCGQCEQKVAAVICHECGEDYCAGCFASFHQKGALRKHRSMPVQANGPRPSPRVPYSPRFPLQQMQNEIMTPQKKALLEFERRQNTPRPKKQTSIQPSHHVENGFSASSENGAALIDGQYDEAESAASFQAALKAWRTGGSTDSEQKESHRPVSPVKSPIVCIESSTSTAPRKNANPDIVYHSSMNYAEKLLLKQHRRSDIDKLSLSPRNVDEAGNRQDDENDQAVSGEERIDFQALYELAVPTPRSDQVTSLKTTVEVQEVSSKTRIKDMEQTSTYEVVEAPDPEGDKLLEKKNEKASKPSSAKKSGRKSSSEKSKPPSGLKTMSKPEREKTGGDLENRSSDKTAQRSGSTASKHEKISSGNTSRISQRKNSADGIESTGKVNTSGKETGRKSSASKASGTLPGKNKTGTNSRPNSRAKSRSQTAVIQSRPQSRVKSRNESRPGSRARSTRPWSRADIGEGVLTKRPSEDLKAIASRVGTVTPLGNHSLQNVFMIGVSKQPAPSMERVMTPSIDRNKKQTVSYKLYQMGPRSWRPDSSLADVADVQPENLQDYEHAFTAADTVLPPSSEDKELEQEIRALAGITTPSVEVIRERTLPESRLADVTLPPSEPTSVPSSSPIPTRTPSITPRPPGSPSNTPRRRSLRSITPQKAQTPRTSVSRSDIPVTERAPSNMALDENEAQITSRSVNRSVTPRIVQTPRTSRSRSDTPVTERGSPNMAVDENEAQMASRSINRSVTPRKMRTPRTSRSRSDTPVTERAASNMAFDDNEALITTRSQRGGSPLSVHLYNGETPSTARSQMETPRNMLHSRCNAEDELLVTPRPSVETPTRAASSMSQNGRESRMIVVDGDDMSQYDVENSHYLQQQEDDDEGTLDQLEWELASETGRLTADGKVSRMTVFSPLEDELALSHSFDSDDHSSPLIKTPVTGYEMDNKVSEDELMLDYDDVEQQVADEEEVRALR